MQRKSLLALIAAALVGLLIVVFFQTPDVEDAGVVAGPEVEPVAAAPIETELPVAPAPEETGRTEEPKWAGLDADLERFAAKPAEEPEPSRVSVMKDADLWYRFVDAVTQEPVEGVEVRSGAMGYSFSGAPLVTSDAEGLVGVDRYFVKGVLAVEASGYGPIRLRVEPGHATGTDHGQVRLRIQPDLITADEAEVVELERGATLVVGFEGRAPPAGAPPGVVLTASGYDLARPATGSGRLLLSMPNVERSATVDAVGECRFVDLPTGVPIEAKVPELRFELEEPLELSPGEVRVVTWKAAGDGRILGSLVDGRGEAIPGRQLDLVRGSSPEGRPLQYLGWLHGQDVVARGRTDANGRFRLEGLPLGVYYVGPPDTMADGKRMWDELAPVSGLAVLTEDAPVAELALVAHRGVYIEGVVVRPSGEPAPDALVLGSSRLGRLDARVDADGRFRLGPLQPVEHRLTAHGRDFSESDEVTALPGGEPVRLVLNLGGTLSGRVVDAATGEVCVAELWYGSGDLRGHRRTSPARSSFDFGGLVPGTYAVGATTADGRIGFRDGLVLEPGTDLEDVVISVAPGATLRLAYPGPDVATWYLVYAGDTLLGYESVSQGETADFVVPAGTITVRAQRGEKEVLGEQTVEAVAGEVHDVTIEHE